MELERFPTLLSPNSFHDDHLRLSRLSCCCKIQVSRCRLFHKFLNEAWFNKCRAHSQLINNWTRFLSDTFFGKYDGDLADSYTLSSYQMLFCTFSITHKALKILWFKIHTTKEALRVFNHLKTPSCTSYLYFRCNTNIIQWQ